MAIQYDKLQQAYQALRTMRQGYLDGVITAEEMATQEVVIRNDIREILGLEPLPA